MQKRATVHCKHCKTWMKTSRIKTSRIFPEVAWAELVASRGLRGGRENKKEHNRKCVYYVKTSISFAVSYVKILSYSQYTFITRRPPSRSGLFGLFSHNLAAETH